MSVTEDGSVDPMDDPVAWFLLMAQHRDEPDPWDALDKLLAELRESD